VHGPKRDAEHQSQDERRQQTLALQVHRPRTGKRQRNDAHQMQAHQKEDQRHEVIPVTPHVTHHPARSRGDDADRRDGDQDAHGKQRRGPECPAGRHSPLLADEADDERDAGEMTGAEDDAQNAPNERRGECDQRRAFDGVAEVGERVVPCV
jgi:hypothetical protein